ncbi:MAG: hypothetical protein AB7J30_00430 [Hyphomicrobium sp.]|uniref:hypothetical protein n=1 Tax=Hyphomicrobium sp. TaxID=82 RepID=UPI003D0F002A
MSVPQVHTFIDLNEESFIERFGPMPNHLDLSAGCDFGDGGCLFAAAGKEFKYVLAQDPHCIWTLIEGDEGALVIESGIHLVNRLGYLVTAEPFETAVTYTVVLDGPEVEPADTSPATTHTAESVSSSSEAQ